MSDFIIQLLPITIVWLIFAVIGWRIARRKGVSTVKTLIGLFPLWFTLFILYWASLTDKDVLERLRRLEGSSH